MNTSLNWIKAMVPGLDVTDRGIQGRNDTFGNKGGKFYRF